MDEQPGMELRPPTERVAARRSAPILVALAAIGALVVFVAQPWGNETPRPTLVALATAASNAPTSTPAETPASTPTPTAPPPILPPPDFGPQTPPGSVSLNDAGSPSVTCSYGRVRQGARRLVSIEVQPPIVLLDESASATDIDRVGWRFQVETNVEQGVFDRDWQYVGASRSQATGTADGRPAAFTPIQMAIRADEMKGTTDVFRVRLVVEWFTRNLEPAGSAEIVASRYRPARAAADEPSWPYCTGVLRG